MQHQESLAAMVQDARERPGLLAVIDNSNIFIAGKWAAGRRNRLQGEDPSWRLSFERLYELITRNAPAVAKAVLFGSLPPPTDDVWKRCEEGEVSVCLSHRKKHGRRKEMEVDTKVTALLAADLGACSAREASRFRSYCLVGGDRDYCISVRHCLQAGFQVNLWAWKSGLAGQYNKLQSEYPDLFHVSFLDEHLDFIGFNEKAGSGSARAAQQPAPTPTPPEPLLTNALPFRSTLAFFSSIVAGSGGKKKRAQAKAAIDKFVGNLPLGCWRQDLQGGHTLVIFQDLLSGKAMRYWRRAATKLVEESTSELSDCFEVLNLREFLARGPSLQPASSFQDHHIASSDEKSNDNDEDVGDDDESTEDDDDGDDDEDENENDGTDATTSGNEPQSPEQLRSRQAVKVEARTKRYPFEGSVAKLEEAFDNYWPEEAPLPAEGWQRCIHREFCIKGINCTFQHSENEKRMFKRHGGVPPFIVQKQHDCPYHTNHDGQLSQKILRTCPLLHPRSGEGKLCPSCLGTPCKHPEKCDSGAHSREILMSAEDERAQGLLQRGYLKRN